MPAANNLQSAIRAIISERQTSARALAAEMKIDHTLFSRLETNRIDPASLAKILAFFESTPSIFHQLIRAHLWDELARAGFDAGPFWKAVADPDLEWYWSLSPNQQGDFFILARFLKSTPSFEFTLKSLAAAATQTMGAASDESTEAKAPAALYALPSDPPVRAVAEPAPKKQRKNTGAPTASRVLPLKPKAS